MKMPWFEGVGNEVLVSIGISLILFVLLVIVIWKNTPRFFFLEEEENDEELPERPPIHNENRCPICWSDQTLALETNCGHLYCGQCLLTLYNSNLSSLRNIITCPLCRTEVNLLFTCFTQEEANVDEASEIAQRRTRIVSFSRMYNRIHSRAERSVLSRIREVPILLRHYFNNAQYGNITGTMFLHLRMYLLLIVSAIYFILPTDILPEAVFGAVGYLDDLLIFGFITVYMSSIYREFIAQNEDS